MASLAPFQGLLGRRHAAHLLRRTSFHFTKARISTLANMTASQAISDLLTLAPPSMPEPVDYQTGQGWINTGVAPVSPNYLLRDFVRAWWVNEARQNPSIGHRMMLFLHSTFVTAPIEGQAAEFFDYLALLRYHALGNIKDLARQMTLDNLMLRYLDNTQNNANSPNENYAREFFELFTIGKGPQLGEGNYTTYTEDDIVEAARLLSGFKIQTDRLNIDPDTGIPRGRTALWAHDKTDKTFSTAFQQLTITGRDTEDGMHDELNDFVEMIFAQAATAQNIVRKLYRFFVSARINPEIEADIILPLSQSLQANGYELQPIVAELLTSEHFFDQDDADDGDEIIGGLIKSPLDLLLHTLSYFDVSLPDPITEGEDHYFRFFRRGLFLSYFPNAGMDVLKPADVAGYPAYYQEPDFHKNWFTSGTVITRYKMPEMLLNGIRMGTNQGLGVVLDPVAYIENKVDIPDDATLLVQELIDDLFPEGVDTDRFSYFRDEIFLDSVPLYDWFEDWNNFQTSGDDSEVRGPLEALLQAILFSQEFQTL